MTYAETQEDFYASFSISKDKHEHSFPVFFTYFMTNWYERADLWAKSQRIDATFHTNNNYVGSYHNQLKSFYFWRTRNQCVDRIIYILSQSPVVINDYHQAIGVQSGLIPMYLSTKERKESQKQMPSDIDQAIYIITQINEYLLISLSVIYWFCNQL
jgi:hypothetical protein